MAEETGIVLPAGVHVPRGEPAPESVTVVNDTGLPNEQVEEAAKTWFVENASLAWGQQTTFQTFIGNQGSLLARTEFRTPTNVIEEIKLAKDLAERDDDVGSTLGSMLALAFGEGMENFHEDETTVAIFNAIAREANLDSVLPDLYREFILASQVNSVCLFTRTNLDFTVAGSDRMQTESVAAPLIGVLPAENVRVLDNDMFRTGQLAYDPDNEALRRWLDEFFNPQTTAARKHAMALQDRVAANLFIGVVEVNMFDLDSDLHSQTGRLYLLNPRLIHRSTMPKGSWKYPRPLITRDFALLEAKRLLNVMDYALLQGGSNFVVVAKKGTDDRPAQAAEIANLKEVVRRASKTGVIVGDHRLSFEIITPELKELLNPDKRRMIGRKLAMAMLRIPEHATEDPGTEGTRTDVEMLARTIQFDRQIIKRHVESGVYAETVKRNPRLFTRGAPKLWFAKIILQGTQYFNDLVLKLRDRGDIPRRWAVEAGGFDWEAGVQQRQRELDQGVDETMAPAAVPFSSPNAGPQDNNNGRVPGGLDDRPRRQLLQVPGETQRAMAIPSGEPVDPVYDEELARVLRVGRITRAILEEFPEFEIGRITGTEREMLDSEEVARRGMSIFVPVNPGYECNDHQAIRLCDGLSMIVGERAVDHARVAKLLVFRESEFAAHQAEDAAIRWGYRVRMPEQLPAPEEPPATPAADPEMAEAIKELAQAVQGQEPPVVNIFHGDRSPEADDPESS